VEKTTDRQIPVSTAPLTSGARRSVNLDIAGEDFMLQGNFGDWESGLAFGPDLDRVRVRLAIDATSTRAEAAAAPSLFAFHGREVESLGDGRYRVIGTFTGPEGAKAMELTVESPLGHTALIVVTFAAKKQDFGEGWHDLIANVVPFREQGVGEGEGPVRLAHAWLVTPPVAAA
jgi:polyisoprenoid-binding protein YceI